MNDREQVLAGTLRRRVVTVCDQHLPMISEALGADDPIIIGLEHELYISSNEQPQMQFAQFGRSIPHQITSTSSKGGSPHSMNTALKKNIRVISKVIEHNLMRFHVVSRQNAHIVMMIDSYSDNHPMELKPKLLLGVPYNFGNPFTSVMTAPNRIIRTPLP